MLIRKYDATIRSSRNEVIMLMELNIPRNPTNTIRKYINVNAFFLFGFYVALTKRYYKKSQDSYLPIMGSVSTKNKNMESAAILFLFVLLRRSIAIFISLQSEPKNKLPLMP